MLPGFRRRDLAHGRASEIFQETGITRCNVGRQYLEKHANRERDIIDTDNYSIGRRAEECFCGNRARGERFDRSLQKEQNASICSRETGNKNHHSSLTIFYCIRLVKVWI